MAKRFGITRNYYNGLESGRQEAGPQIMRLLEIMEQGQALNVKLVSSGANVPKGTDFEGGITGKEGIISPVVSVREDYMPKFGEKKGLLTRGELEDYVIRYLDYAQKHEGGMAIAQATILKNLTIDIFEHLPKK